MSNWVTTLAVVGAALLHFILEGRIKARPLPTEKILDPKSTRLFSLVSLTCMALPVLERLVVGPAQSVPAWYIVGLPIMVLGIELRVHSIHELGRFFTYPVCVRHGHILVQTGLYARLRHPSYFANLLIVGGAAVLLQSHWLIAGLGAYVAMTLWRIHVEERALIAHFGGEYVEYRQKTRALIPFLY